MRTKVTKVVCMAVLGMRGSVTSLSAHHAFAAEFDANKPVSFKGRSRSHLRYRRVPLPDVLDSSHSYSSPRLAKRTVSNLTG